nr:SRPBCC family protein [Kibdelosporangium phytohabitans]
MSSPSSDAAETFDVRVSVPVALDPDALFGYVTDLPRSGEWSPECLGGEWVSGEPAAVGSVFAARNRRSPDVVAWAPVVRGEWATKCQVVASDAAKTFSWAMLDSAGNVQESVWTFEIEASGDGSVLTHAFRMGRLTEGMRGILGGLDDDGKRQFVVDWTAKLEADMRQSVDRIRAAVESGS